MNRIELTGLYGATPIGFMASIGILRVLNEIADIHAQLSFGPSPTFHANLKAEEIVDSKKLIDKLSEALRGRSQAPMLGWSSERDVKVTPNEFRSSAVRPALNQYRIGCIEFIDFVTAFGTDAALDNKGNVKPTSFHFTSGQQRFLKGAWDAACCVDIDHRPGKKSTEASQHEAVKSTIREALIGPWSYESKVHSLGWDTATEALYALEAGSPSDAGARSAPAAVWLAFESLPIFPTMPVATNRGVMRRTAGFNATEDSFSWPIWSEPLRLDTVRSMIAVASKLDSEKSEEAALRDIGIDILFSSVAQRDDNGRGTFRNQMI